MIYTLDSVSTCNQTSCEANLVKTESGCRTENINSTTLQLWVLIKLNVRDVMSGTKTLP